MVELRGICKSFGSKIVLQDVNLHVGAGQVHAIVGENGAGKTTLMRILSGILEPDQGVIASGEREFSSLTPELASQLGVAMIHQHFLLDDELSILDNFILTSPQQWSRPQVLPQWLRWLDRRRAKPVVQNQLPENVQAEELVSSASVGLKQRLEILRVLIKNPRLIIFDEPTAVLNEIERQKLFNKIQELKSQGCAVVYISHKLTEVFELADQITVLKNGQCSPALNPSTVSMGQVAQMMVGEIPKNPTKRSAQAQEIILQIHSDKTPLQVRRGEIVGIAGVEGNGQNALVRGILDPTRREDIQVQILNQNQTKLNQVRQCGVGFVSDDRHKESAIAQMTLLENWQMADLPTQAFTEAIGRLEVKPNSPTEIFANLSGGNQQKFVLARELALAKNLLIASEPTRGVDLRAKNKIHEAILKVAEAGTACLVVSSDLEELSTLCHRIFVIYRGQWVREFTSQGLDQQHVAMAMAGV